MTSTEPAEVVVASASRARPSRGFRTDIEGLRAIAVLAVLAFHAGMPGFDGGYVGVDVFFAVSGFLITGLLVDERATTGSLSLTRFYARRARRLLPAATLVLFAVLAGAAVLGGPLDLHNAGLDGRAVASFTANFRFSGMRTGYFAATTRPSPFLHYWSLAVEEQFYLLWPALVLLVTAGVAGADAQRARLTRALVVLVAASYLASVRLTPGSQPTAFYLLPTRAWELGLGALVVLAPRMAWRRRTATAVALAGVALVVVSLVTFGRVHSFPGWAAAVPVVGTALVLLAGSASPDTVVARVLSTRPMQRIGAYSYSLYVWHWAVLAVVAMHHRTVFDSWHRGAAVVAASVPMAIVAFHVIEDPVRRSRWLAIKPARSLLLGAVLVVAGLVGSTAAVALPRLHTGRTASGDSATDFVPRNLRPSIAGARAAPSLLDRAPSCDTDKSTTKDSPCYFGDRKSSTTIVLLGDSHAAMWFDPVLALAQQRHWRLEVDVTGGCTALSYEMHPECTRHLNLVLDRLARQRPAYVVVADYGRHSFDFGLDEPAWQDATRRTLERLRQSHVLLFGETARPNGEADRCLARHIDDVRPCEPNPHDPMLERMLADGSRVAEQVGASFVDLNPLLCSSDRCPIIRGNRLVYADENHVTGVYVRSIRDHVLRLLGEATQEKIRAA